ncbi:MAG: hypothetical protein BJ554DRAFT_5376 [Olpidium bornovanus]|uniref:Aminoglycoside phosphotransferase domain-containing protein n=1 Tax=Olpidium bornovanus TaxID=278681 RepID=A0A8H7ZZS5_9FUNG|nr:MAG: hypothetical protein BJ554DRAFT_5376 [Olpidium bornovanus]
MEYVEGRIFSDVTFPTLTPEGRRSWYECAVSEAPQAARRDPCRFTLTPITHPSAGSRRSKPSRRCTPLITEPLDSRITGSQADFTRGRCASLRKVSNAQAAVRKRETGEAVGRIPRLEEMLDWFERNQVADASAIIHGDFKVFHPTEPRVIGILDWELSTIGHPLSDLANLLQPYYVPSQNTFPETSLMSGLKNEESLPPGLPAVKDLIDAYRMMTGTSVINRWEFCVAFALFRVRPCAVPPGHALLRSDLLRDSPGGACFRSHNGRRPPPPCPPPPPHLPSSRIHIQLAVISQGIAARVALGQASSSEARKYARLFRPVAGLALEYVDRGNLPDGPGDGRPSKL